MKSSDAIDLIKLGLSHNTEAEVWADLGAGSGTFTRALASLLKAGSIIYAMDRSASTLDPTVYANASIVHVKIDFVEEEITVHQLDGVLMANAFHFVADKMSFVRKLKKSLKASGRLILVEYNFDTPSHWVPHPISYKTLTRRRDDWGFQSVTMIGQRPSIYNQASMYSAVIEF